jgi:hypothetical protein
VLSQSTYATHMLVDKPWQTLCYVGGDGKVYIANLKLPTLLYAYRELRAASQLIIAFMRCKL